MTEDGLVSSFEMSQSWGRRSALTAYPYTLGRDTPEQRVAGRGRLGNTAFCAVYVGPQVWHWDSFGSRGDTRHPCAVEDGFSSGGVQKRSSDVRPPRGQRCCCPHPLTARDLLNVDPGRDSTDSECFSACSFARWVQRWGNRWLASGDFAMLLQRDGASRLLLVPSKPPTPAFH